MAPARGAVRGRPGWRLHLDGRSAARTAWHGGARRSATGIWRGAAIVPSTMHALTAGSRVDGSRIRGRAISVTGCHSRDTPRPDSRRIDPAPAAVHHMSDTPHDDNPSALARSPADSGPAGETRAGALARRTARGAGADRRACRGHRRRPVPSCPRRDEATLTPTVRSFGPGPTGRRACSSTGRPPKRCATRSASSARPRSRSATLRRASARGRPSLPRPLQSLADPTVFSETQSGRFRTPDAPGADGCATWCSPSRR